MERDLDRLLLFPLEDRDRERELDFSFVCCWSLGCGGLIFTLQIQKRNRKIEITEGKTHTNFKKTDKQTEKK